MMSFVSFPPDIFAYINKYLPNADVRNVKFVTERYTCWKYELHDEVNMVNMMEVRNDFGRYFARLVGICCDGVNDNLRHPELNGMVKKIILCATHLKGSVTFPVGLEKLEITNRRRATNDITYSMNLPEGLLELQIGFGRCETPLILPESLTKLHLLCCYVKMKFPSGLLDLALPFGYCDSGDFQEFPSNLTSLAVTSTLWPKCGLPSGLTRLDIECTDDKFGKIPDGVVDLTVRTRTDIDFKYPPGLKKLSLITRSSRCRLLNDLPNGLVSFKWKGEIHDDVVLKLPKSLINFELWGIYNKPLELHEGLELIILKCVHKHPLQLPGSLIVFDMGDHYEIPTDFPDRLTKLYLSDSYNHPMKVPEKLVQLKLGKKFDQRLELPDSLTHLKLGKCYDFPLVLPSGLKKLVCDKDYKKWLDYFVENRAHVPENCVVKFYD